MITVGLLSGMSPLLSSKGPIRPLEAAIKACDLSAVRVEFKKLKSRSEPDVLKKQLEELLETAHDVLDNPPAPKDTCSQGSPLFKGIFGIFLIAKIAPFLLFGGSKLMFDTADGQNEVKSAARIALGAGMTAIGLIVARNGINYISEALGQNTISSNLKNAQTVVDFLEKSLVTLQEDLPEA